MSEIVDCTCKTTGSQKCPISVKFNLRYLSGENIPLNDFPVPTKFEGYKKDWFAYLDLVQNQYDREMKHVTEP